MSVLSKIVGGTASEPIEAIGRVFDQLFTSDEERAQAEAVLTKIAQQPHILQAEINKIEASHRSLFVAGWRPAVGWVCAFALAWHFMLFDMVSWIQSVHYPNTPKLPSLNGTSHLITVLMAMLGLGGLRTVEKLKGRAK